MGLSATSRPWSIHESSSCAMYNVAHLDIGSYLMKLPDRVQEVFRQKIQLDPRPAYTIFRKEESRSCPDEGVKRTVVKHGIGPRQNDDFNPESPAFATCEIEQVEPLPPVPEAKTPDVTSEKELTCLAKVVEFLKDLLERIGRCIRRTFPCLFATHCA